jgi:hypothetical protein
MADEKNTRQVRLTRAVIMSDEKNTRRVRLTRAVIMGGEHAEEGSVHEVSRSLAHRLVGEGSAEYHLEEGEEPETGPTTVNRMENPGNADPPPRRVVGASPKVREK